MSEAAETHVLDLEVIIYAVLRAFAPKPGLANAPEGTHCIVLPTPQNLGSLLRRLASPDGECRFRRLYREPGIGCSELRNGTDDTCLGRIVDG